MSTIAHNYQKEAKTAGFLRFAPWISRFPLVAATFIFTAIASKFLFDPVHTAAVQGISFASGVGITVARIGFGAFPLAFAIITLSCLVSKRRILTGIYIVLTVISVALLVRIFGMIADNSVKESMQVLVPEIVLLVISVVALNVEVRRRRHEPADGTAA
jgi:fucose permease